MKSRKCVPSFLSSRSLRLVATLGFAWFAAFTVNGCRTSSRGDGDVVLVRDGRARAVVVLSAAPSPTARYAAEELVSHTRAVTGATLPVALETEIPGGYESRVYLGATAAAARLGLDAAAMGADVFRLRSHGRDLYVVGREDPEADPLSGGNARLSAAMIDLLSRPLPPRDGDAFRAAQRQVRELAAFRRAHEHRFIADYSRLADLENTNFDDALDALLD